MKSSDKSRGRLKQNIVDIKKQKGYFEIDIQ